MGSPIVHPTTILVADDDPSLLRFLDFVLSSQRDVTVVGQALTADEAIIMAGALQPDIALVDVEMPGDGTRAAAEILRCSPATRVIALSGHDDFASVLGMVIAGATGYILKGSDIDELVAMIRDIADGRTVAPGDLVASILRQAEGILRRKQDKDLELGLMREEIRGIIEAQLFHVVFQPVVEMASGKVAGLEALARFDIEPRVGPDVWFARAARVGMLEQLEVCTVERALSYLHRLPEPMLLSINVSPSTIIGSEDFRAVMLTAPPERIVVEITEHAPVADYEGLQQALGPLRLAGVHLAIDDAGAGFASLRHILSVGPDIIKLDVGLTRGIHRDSRKRALAAALISFARDTDTTIVAEGIETHDELDALRSLGVRYGQGYLLGRPLPLQASYPQVLL